MDVVSQMSSYEVDLPLSRYDDRNDRQDKEQPAQRDGDPKQGLFYATPCSKYTAGILTSKPTQAKSLGL